MKALCTVAVLTVLTAPVLVSKQEPTHGSSAASDLNLNGRPMNGEGPVNPPSPAPMAEGPVNPPTPAPVAEGPVNPPSPAPVAEGPVNPPSPAPVADASSSPSAPAA